MQGGLYHKQLSYFSLFYLFPIFLILEVTLIFILGTSSYGSDKVDYKVDCTSQQQPNNENKPVRCSIGTFVGVNDGTLVL